MLGFDLSPNLPVCSDFHSGYPDHKKVVTATIGHVQRLRDSCLGPSLASPLHLALGCQLQNKHHQNITFSAKEAPLSWEG